MENRFGVKDFVVLMVLGVIVIMIAFKLVQDDRQWTNLTSTNETLREQSGTQNEILDRISKVEERQADDDAYAELSQKVDTLTKALEKLSRQGGAQNGSGLGGAVSEAGNGTDVTEGIDAEHDPFKRIKAAKTNPDYAGGGWMIDVFGGGVAKLTPLLSGDAYASIIQSYVVDSLCTRDPVTLEWIGVIARDWEISEDGLTITFNLRKGPRFSDGEPVTADDVVFSYNFIMNPEINAPRYRAYLERIKSVEKIDDYTVVFKYEEPYFESFELAASFEVLPEHWYGRFATKDFNDSVGLLMGSGPYRMEDPAGWKPGSGTIRLVRNERYWGTKPAFDQLLFKIITSDVARETAFRNGDVDMLGAAPEQYRKMTQDEDLVARTHHYDYQSPSGGYRYIAWNQKRQGKDTRFSDVRVRRAMTMLLDRQRIIEEVLLGYGVIATGPFNPLGEQYNTDITPIPYDVKAAKALLKEAGFEDRDGDGQIESESGVPFAFTLTYPSGSELYARLMEFLKDSYARAGIVLKPDPLEWAVFTERLRTKDFEAITLGWTSGIETDIYQMFHSSQTDDNFMSYKSERLDKMIEQARQTVDKDKRMPMWRECHKILNEDQPYTFLHFGNSLRFFNDRVHNVQKVKLGLNDRLEWYFPGSVARRQP